MGALESFRNPLNLEIVEPFNVAPPPTLDDLADVVGNIGFFNTLFAGGNPVGGGGAIIYFRIVTANSSMGVSPNYNDVANSSLALPAGTFLLIAMCGFINSDVTPGRGTFQLVPSTTGATGSPFTMRLPVLSPIPPNDLTGVSVAMMDVQVLPAGTYKLQGLSTIGGITLGSGVWSAIKLA